MSARERNDRMHSTANLCGDRVGRESAEEGLYPIGGEEDELLDVCRPVKQTGQVKFPTSAKGRPRDSLDAVQLLNGCALPLLEVRVVTEAPLLATEESFEPSIHFILARRLLDLPAQADVGSSGER